MDVAPKIPPSSFGKQVCSHRCAQLRCKRHVWACVFARTSKCLHLHTNSRGPEIVGLPPSPHLPHTSFVACLRSRMSPPRVYISSVPRPSPQVEIHRDTNHLTCQVLYARGTSRRSGIRRRCTVQMAVRLRSQCHDTDTGGFAPGIPRVGQASFCPRNLRGKIVILSWPLVCTPPELQHVCLPVRLAVSLPKAMPACHVVHIIAAR